MLIPKLTIFLVSLLLIACTPAEPTQTGNNIPENAAKEINWDQAKEIILSGKVETIVQAHDRKLTLELNDGSQFITIEPDLET